jgi:Sugar kinases, ribokinase family
LLATGTGLAQSPSRETTLGALAEHQGTTIFDLDWRPTLWERADEYGTLARTAVGYADIVIGNEEEVEAAAGDPQALLELGVRTSCSSVVSAARCSSTKVERSTCRDIRWTSSTASAPATRSSPAFVQSLYTNQPLEEAVRRGSVAGAIVASQLACSEAMPRLEELEAELT